MIDNFTKSHLNIGRQIQSIQKLGGEFVKFMSGSAGNVLLYMQLLRLCDKGVFYGKSIRFSRGWQTTSTER